jgi:hypothetical protein
MFRRDYIIRLIEEFGILWARLIEHLRGGDVSAARLVIDTTYQRLLGMTPDEVLALPSAHLMARLQLGATPEAGREQCWMMSSLFRAEGDLAQAAGQADAARQYYQRAREIALSIERQYPDTTPPSYAQTSQQLGELMGGE